MIIFQKKKKMIVRETVLELKYCKILCDTCSRINPGLSSLSMQ